MGAVYLIRHGQASFGAADYDALSALGHEQSRALGYAWEASGWLPTHAVSGAMRRHHETAVGVLAAAGQDAGYDVDEGWNEFDHVAMLGAFHTGVVPTDPRGFQEAFKAAARRWASGETHADCPESFAQFNNRAVAAFDRVANAVGKGQSAAVFTSGGAIGAVVSHLVAGDDSLWHVFNHVTINTGVTKIVTGQSGRNLLSFNEHGHLTHDSITYR